MTKCEQEFEVDESPSEVWSRLVAAQPAELAPPATPRRWWLPGFDSTGEELEIDEPRQLTVRKDTMPCEGTTIAFTFEHTSTGTKITVVQSGFDEAFVEGAGESFWIVAEQIAVDVRLFFEQGVNGGRHGRPWAFLGCGTRTTPVGLEVTGVMPDTYAARAGFEPGDLLLTLAGAPVVSERDLTTLLRALEHGTDVAATRARAGELISGSAVL